MAGHIRVEAHQLTDFGTVQVLEEVLTGREDLGYYLYSTLEGDTLVRGITPMRSGNNDRTGFIIIQYIRR
ncbi:hypothetical protein [Thalassobacillus sp. C254]|uniref:hypothetical protein n=1 Tax=Thalassobacillus sp. C254 TaxID=1225341 RepID=UPI0018DEB445|nr:hypothetical protein [Thalassobacillus sp. C254]